MKTAQIKLSNGFTPYPEYKDSGIEWIGKIPKEWNIMPLRSVAIENEERNYDGRCQNLLSLSYGKIIEKDINTNNGLLPESFNTYQIVKKGDIVFRLTDLQNDKRSLRVGYNEIDKSGIITSAYLALVTKESLDDKYAYYLFHSYDLQKVYYGMGGGVRQTLDYSDFKYLPILSPNIEIQKKIAEYLDEKTMLIDQIIEKKKKLIALLREKRTAVINQAVTKGLDPNIELVDSGIEWLGKIPKGWNKLSLKRLLVSKITDGPHTTPVLLDSGVPFISAESIQGNNEINFNKRRGFISVDDHNEFCRKSKPQRNDIFMVKSGATTGRIGLVKTDEEFSIWSPLALIRAKKKMILPEYLFYFLTSTLFQEQVKISWSFGTQQNIGMGVIENLLILFPDVQGQKQIIQFYDRNIGHYDQAINLVENSIESLKEFKSSLISNVVTGKVKI